MGATAVRMTVAQFHEWAEQQSKVYEMVHGEAREKPVAHFGHQKVNANITRLLVRFLSSNPIGEVFPETMFEVTGEDARQPDNAVLLGERWIKTPANSYPSGAPDLAIEVVSSESAAELEDKVDLYLQNGARCVWAVYPRHRTVWVHRPDGVTLRLKESDYLEAPELLPGFRVQVAELFAGLSAD